MTSMPPPTWEYVTGLQFKLEREIAELKGQRNKYRAIVKKENQSAESSISNNIIKDIGKFKYAISQIEFKLFIAEKKTLEIRSKINLGARPGCELILNTIAVDRIKENLSWIETVVNELERQVNEIQ